MNNAVLSIVLVFRWCACFVAIRAAFVHVRWLQTTEFPQCLFFLYFRRTSPSLTYANRHIFRVSSALRVLFVLVKYEKWNIKCCISKSTVFFPIVVVYSSFYPFKQTRKLVHRICSALLVFSFTFYHSVLFILMSFSAFSFFICLASIFWCSCHSFTFLSDELLEYRIVRKDFCNRQMKS